MGREIRGFFFYFWGLKSRYIFTPVNQHDFTSNLLTIIVGLTKSLLDEQLVLPEVTQQKVERAKGFLKTQPIINLRSINLFIYKTINSPNSIET